MCFAALLAASNNYTCTLHWLNMFSGLVVCLKIGLLLLSSTKKKKQDNNRYVIQYNIAASTRVQCDIVLYQGYCTCIISKSDYSVSAL